MILGLDHLVILVRDLDRAVSDYERLGFAVTPGGEHADGLTRNALIPFRDGTYLEIVAFLDPDDPRDNVWGWRQLAATGGLVDHCLASHDLAADARRLREAGFEVAGPSDGGRRLPGGGEIRWRSTSISQEGRTLPFLIEDLTPRERRVPTGQAAEHPNGASGILALEITAPEPDLAARHYAAVVESPAAWEDSEISVRVGGRTVSFSGASGGDVRSGPHSATLAALVEGGGELNPDFSHGARIRLG